LKLLANIPRELNDLSILNPNELLLAADDSVYIVQIPKEKRDRIKIKELFRWTGTNIISVDAYSNRIIAGTNKGVIIFYKNKAKPVWVGYPCNVFAGKFSDKIDIICLAKPPHKMSRILDIFAFSSSDVETGQIRSLKGIEEEVVYFSTSIGPIQEFAFNRIKNLTVKSDIDNDGYLELVLITPEREPKLSVIDIVDEVIRRVEYELPSFVGNPILLDYRDLNEDGEKELYVVSMLNDFEAVISILSISENKNKVSVSVLTKIDMKDLFGEEISDDGVLYAFLGQFDNDGLPEIVGIWEEPSDKDGFISKIMPFKVNFLGEIILPKRANQEEITIKKVVISDIDLDSLLELIIFNESGFSIYKLSEHKKSLVLSKISEFRLPMSIESLSRNNGSLLVSGPISTRLDSPWSLLRVNLDSDEIESIGVFPKVLKLECFDEACIVITNDKRLFIISDSCFKEVKNIIDASIVDGGIVSIIRNKGLYRFKVDVKNCRIRKNKLVELQLEGFFIKSVDNTNHICIFLNNEGELFLHDLKKRLSRRIKLLDLLINQNKYFIRGYTYTEKNRNYFVFISKNYVHVVDDNGKPIVHKNLLFDDFYDLFLLRKSAKKHEVVLLFARKKELYKFDLFKGFEERLSLDNVTSLVVEKKAGKVLVAFQNNWIAEYEFGEVIQTEDKGSSD